MEKKFGSFPDMLLFGRDSLALLAIHTRQKYDTYIKVCVIKLEFMGTLEIYCKKLLEDTQAYLNLKLSANDRE